MSDVTRPRTGRAAPSVGTPIDRVDGRLKVTGGAGTPPSSRYLTSRTR